MVKELSTRGGVWGRLPPREIKLIVGAQRPTGLSVQAERLTADPGRTELGSPVIINELMALFDSPQAARGEGARGVGSGQASRGVRIAMVGAHRLELWTR
jgi:hypothetical protein